MRSLTNTVSRENATVIHFARSRAQSRVSIGFSCTISEIQNTGHSQCIMGCRTSMASRKNVTVINFVRSRAHSRVSIGFSCTILEIQNIGHSRRISQWEVIQTRFHEKTRRSYSLCEVARRVEFRSVFRALSHKFKILTIPDVLVHGKSYEHGFAKNSTVIYFARIARRVEFRSVFRAPSEKFKILAIPDVLAHVKFRSVFLPPSRKFKTLAIPDVLAHVEFRLVFRASSRKFKILAIPDILAHGKSYKYDFAKQRDGLKLCKDVNLELRTLIFNR
ncbi:hypothetical protein BHM03_00046318 [Ensete ventricosum]|nr:hypothetical protein BHM03_00046318 [Ensete ventricosum]